MQCTNQLRQLALAVQNFADAHKTLPDPTNPDHSALASMYGTWTVSVIPFMEEATMAGQYQNFGNALANGATYANDPNLTLVTSNHLPALTCPSDDPSTDGWPGSGMRVAYHNYALNGGNTPLSGDESVLTPISPYNGVIFNGAPFVKGKLQRLKDIQDGTSQTFLAGEVIQGHRSDLRGLIYWAPAACFTTYLRPNDTQPDVFWASYGWCDPNPPNPPCQPWTSPSMFMLAARSRHPGGVNVALVDGSARFLADDIDVTLWRSLSTSKGGETVTVPN